ncbi:MAG TPA: cytochrome c biogenesis protein ResB [Blastocatellia bacterium]|nr:cytochrome c biogenesis protein ResB [Blastocatellia bacterium]
MSAASPVLNEGVAVPNPEQEGSESEASRTAKRGKGSGFNTIIDRFLNLLSSVPFGIILLVFLIIACMIGMLIQQQELESFSGYYNELTPGEKIVYGRLGFFDIYHVWYFNLLLLMLSLNIILASIDHFPASWSFIARKKLTASPMFVMAQKFKEQVELPKQDRKELTELAVSAARALKFKVRVTEGEDRTTVFAERGVWNRMGAYVVHIGLLTIFLGGFLTSRGYVGSMPVTPGKTENKMIQNVFNVEHATTQFAIGRRELVLPFTIEGIDIQHKPIKKGGSIDPGNTLDWLTRIRIRDPETGQNTEALVHMNTPYDYRGYRFFQASYTTVGSARTVTIRVHSNANGQQQDVTIPRDGEVKLADGTRLKYADFVPHLTVNREGRVQMASGEYENPAAQILYITPDGKEGESWALNQQFINEIANAPFLKSAFPNNGPYQFLLADYERVALDHILSVQFDPGAKVVYVGFTILCLTLIAVFFFSHQRLWIVVEDGKVHLGGDSNRNRLGFEDRVRKIIALIREPRIAS